MSIFPNATIQDANRLLRRTNIGGYEYLINKDLGVLPIFTWEIRNRVRQKKACNIVVVGEAGTGKSYVGMEICRSINRSFGRIDSRYAKLDPVFNIPQVVFSYNEYLQILLRLGRGHPIMLDEPSYAIGKREWYKQVNMAMVKSIESARFMVKPLIIPIINTSLLDKTIRSYLIQYMVVLHDRGRGVVYRIQASQFQEKVYKRFVCRIRYGMMDSNQCNRDSCLGCKKMKGCYLLRARYEKKKESIQLGRYAQDLEETKAMEGTRLTLEQLMEKAIPLMDQFTSDKQIDVTKMKLLIRTEHKIRIGNNKAYDLKKLMEIKHPEWFG